MVWLLSVCDRINPRQIVLPLCYTAIPSIGILKAWRVHEWKRHLGVGEIAQGLRALAVLPEDPASVPSTHNGSLTIIENSSFRESDTLSGFCGHRHDMPGCKTPIHVRLK